MINSGWANNCGVQQFTLGWVSCDHQVRGGKPRRRIIIGLPKKPIDPVIKEEEFKGTTLPPVVETALKDVLLTGSATINDTIIEFDSVPKAPQRPISLLAPELANIKSDIDREIAELIRMQELQRYEKLRLEYEEAVRLFEEEFIVFIMLMVE